MAAGEKGEARGVVAGTLGIIARLDRAIQYAETPVVLSRGRGVLDSPLSQGMTAEGEETPRLTSRWRPGYSNTASAAATDSALSVTVRSSAPACTVMFSAKKRASET